ncbi:hypothetical protein ABPG74_013417 [Tetrahymena malaccensis]
MKSKGVTELPKIKINATNNLSSSQSRQGYQNNSYLAQYPQSTRNSYQTPYWNSKNLNQYNNSQEESLSHRQYSSQYDDQQKNTQIYSNSRKNSQNYSPEITQSARSSSVILDNSSQSKYKYYNQAQANQNGSQGNQDFHSQTFRPSITPQSQSFAYSKQDRYSQEGETRTYFYTNNQQRNKKVTQSHQQGFYPSDDLSDDKQYSEQIDTQYNDKVNYEQNSQSYRETESNSEQQKNSNDYMPKLEQSSTLYSEKKTFLPKTTENYKFFLNSALKDIHGIYSKNQQLEKANKEKIRYRSTSKSQATQENFFEPRKRLNSISSSQKQSSQDVYFNQIKQQPSSQEEFHKRNEQLVLKNTNYSDINQINYVTQSTKNSQKPHHIQQMSHQNNLNLHQENDKNYDEQFNYRASVDLGQMKQNTNYDFFMKETNQNHLRKNFHSKRIDELSKPKYPTIKQQAYPQEKAQSQVQKKRKQSPQKVQPDKQSNITQIQNNSEGQQKVRVKDPKESKQNTQSNNNSLVKENQSTLKTDGKEKNKNNKTQVNCETQNLADSKVFEMDLLNDENDLDSSFEKLQKTVKQQNEVQEKLSQNGKNPTYNLTSIDKIRILTGKGKFHFSKKIDQNQQQDQQVNLQQTKDFVKQQRIAQIRNDKIERILSLKNTDNFRNSLESNFSSQSLGKMEKQGEINLFTSSQDDRFSQTFSKFQSSRLLNTEKLKGRKIEFTVNYGFKLDKEIEFYRKQKEQKELKEKEEGEQKLRQQKEIISKQIYERERHRNLDVDIVIHSEEIQTKLVFGEKVSFIKIPVVQIAEELDIQYIQQIDQFSSLCTSQKQMKGEQFILRKEKLTELKQQHYLFHINSLMAKENDLYVKDPVAVRVDSEYYLLQFYKVYRKLRDILLMQNSYTIQSKLYQNKSSNYEEDDYSITNQENEEEEVRDQPFLSESQIIHIYKQILENITQMNEILNIFHSNLNLDNIALFEGNCVSIINFDETQIIFNKANQKISNKNYIISNNNLQRVQYQKYVKFEEISSQEQFSPLEYQLHDIICLFIQLKFANPDLMSENQFKQCIKIINLEQPLSVSGQIIKQLIQYQQLQQQNLIQSYADTIYIDRHGYGMDYLISYKYQKQENYIDQILFYLTNLQLQKSNQMINCLSQQYSSEQLILRAFYYYLTKQYELSYEELLQFEKEYIEAYYKEQVQNKEKKVEDEKISTINKKILQNVYFWKGRIEFMNKQFDKSDQSFEKYINISKDTCNSLLGLADFYKQVVNLNKSIFYYEQAEKYVINNKDLNLYQIYYVQIMKRQIYFYQNTDNMDKQVEVANRCIQFLTQTYKDEQDCELVSFKHQFSNLISQQSQTKKQ